ncbi:hypothetical protein FOTG_18468 [Fusarium oxysporum f. sp. vasinfectum 25433]|uniref:Uncharacterized protein n=1 Tax=Fusarium oxysporum f. sp. vasinfectum 25433 TaxID=1089449 RepID=X0KW89_FUSOX|nr:hypothetical protein FOTG_18468 [Fusarium oxysporum f. sp. vasinfectum 25433]
MQSLYPRNSSPRFLISAVALIGTFLVRATTSNTFVTTAHTFDYGLALSLEPRFAAYEPTLLKAM